MSPIWVTPPGVATASVRRVSEAEPEALPVQHVVVPVVAVAHAVPRQPDPLARRLAALQAENDQLRAELRELRTT